MKLDCQNGFVAVPRDAVTVNGIYLERLNTAPDDYKGQFVLLFPSGKPAMDENGSRPYSYLDADEVRADALVLFEHCQKGFIPSDYSGVKPKKPTVDELIEECRAEETAAEEFEMIFVAVERSAGLAWVLFHLCEMACICAKIEEARETFGKSSAVLMVHHYPGGAMPAAEYDAEGLRGFLFECVLSNAGG